MTANTNAYYNPAGNASFSNVNASKATKRFVSRFKKTSFLNNLKDEEVINGKKLINPHTAPQHQLLQAIIDDQEQWEKFQIAMQSRRCRSNMSLTQNLHGLIQERIHEMVETERSLLNGGGQDS